MVSGRRGQAYTLEGVLAAILVISATVFGITSIDTRAWEDGTREETRRLETRADDLLTVGKNTGALENAILCYNSGRTRINGNNSSRPAEFERMLNLTFDSRGEQYNIYFNYLNETGEQRVTELVSENSPASANRPSTGAAVATRTVALTDNMSVRTNSPSNACGNAGPRVKSLSSFYIPDADNNTRLYNLVEVRLIVW
ncbi:DUF7288 family protein [Haloarcula pelagica]|uniref:DUF7288 family protein n=1 Tax=Haloarcula pelagica TaxID=3033389 RepID=UPI0024C47171|nr:hypothetical protein [Halomicroarcula sp. YJ-61-S]